MKTPRLGPGRPKKYGRTARAVTIRLPEDILRRLESVDADLGRAIVALVERNRRGKVQSSQSAEVAEYGRRAVIVVKPVKALERLPGVELVPLGNGRALISLSSVQSAAQLELDVRDALESRGVSADEREALQAILDILQRTRRSSALAVEHRAIIVLEPRRTRQAGKRAPRRSSR
ncbi:MAG: hypothetical protein AB7Q29_19195 [Vicinamibacterales bacterium]